MTVHERMSVLKLWTSTEIKQKEMNSAQNKEGIRRGTELLKEVKDKHKYIQ